MSLTEKVVLERSKARSLDTVRHLNVWGCQLVDISLISNLPNLEVLNLSCNNLTSLKDIRPCHKLTELYVRRNKLESLDELEHLTQLKHLKILWLNDNPLSQVPEYRETVSKLLPQVTKLDNVSVLKGTKEGRQNILQAVMLLLGELDREDLAKVQRKAKDLLR